MTAVVVVPKMKTSNSNSSKMESLLAFEAEFQSEREFVTHDFTPCRTVIRLGNFHNQRVAFKFSRYLGSFEIAVHQKLGSHPRIVQFLKKVDMSEASDEHQGFLMEAFGSGLTVDRHLSGLSSPIPLELCVKWIRELAQGLVYIHSQGILHHDLTPHNLLLDQEFNLKIADFGISEFLDEKGQANFEYRELGRLGWMAPEQIRDSDGPITVKADVYNFGRICQSLLYRFRKPSQLFLEIPQTLSRLITSCLRDQSFLRPTMDQFLKDFEAIDFNQKNDLLEFKEKYELASAAKLELPPEMTKAYLDLKQLLKQMDS